VVLAVDTSVIAVGFILSQQGEDGKHYPNRFGSISLMSVESRYSQAKLELYELFRALRAVRVFIFGAANLVEMDAKYVKGMINNPDLQLSVTINQWIAGILLFHFKLCHIPADKHAGPDGLSCRPPSDADSPEEDDVEGWLDDSYSFGISLLNDRMLPFAAAPSAPTFCHHFPYFSSFVSAAPDCILLTLDFPNVSPLTYVSAFSSSVSPSSDDLDALPVTPSIPWSAKATVKKARIRSIRGFLES